MADCPPFADVIMRKDSKTAVETKCATVGGEIASQADSKLHNQSNSVEIINLCCASAVNGADSRTAKK